MFINILRSPHRDDKLLSARAPKEDRYHRSIVHNISTKKLVGSLLSPRCNTWNPAIPLLPPTETRLPPVCDLNTVLASKQRIESKNGGGDPDIDQTPKTTKNRLEETTNSATHRKTLLVSRSSKSKPCLDFTKRRIIIHNYLTNQTPNETVHKTDE